MWLVNVRIVMRPTIIFVGLAPHGVCDGVWACLSCNEGGWESNRSLIRSDRRRPDSCKLIRGGSLNLSTFDSRFVSEMLCAGDIRTLSVSFPRMIWPLILVLDCERTQALSALASLPLPGRNNGALLGDVKSSPSEAVIWDDDNADVCSCFVESVGWLLRRALFCGIPVTTAYGSRTGSSASCKSVWSLFMEIVVSLLFPSQAQ